MNLLRVWLRRLWYLLKRSSIENDLQKEMEIHRSMMSEPVRFGNTLRLREEARKVWGWNWLDDAKGDLQYAVRVFRRNPAFTLIAVLMLAVGIGANTAMFTQVNAVMLRMIPVRHAEELQQLEWSSVNPGFAQTRNGGLRRNAVNEPSAYFSYSAYQNVRDHTASFSSVLAFNYTTLNVNVQNGALRLQGQMVSGNYFQTLGGDTILLGRPIGSADDLTGASTPIVVLSYGCWQREFGGDPSVLGRELSINGNAFVIVGVTRKEFQGLDPGRSVDLFLPISEHRLLTAQPNVLTNTENWTAARVVGRLKPEVSVEQARLESEALVRQTILASPPRNKYAAPQVFLTSLAYGVDDLRKSETQSLLILMAVVGIVLIITCANLAGVMLAKASTRHREIATRLAIGAPGSRLIRQLLTESLLLTSVGGMAGFVLAYMLGWALPSPLREMSDTLAIDLAPDLRVLAFSAALILVTGVALGLLPAIRAGRLDLVSAIKQSASVTLDRHSGLKAGKVLVVVQVALSLLLLIGAGLLTRTLINLKSVPLGIQTDGLLQFASDPSLNGYRGTQRADYFEDAVRRIENAPGVKGVTLSQTLMIGSSNSQRLCVPGYQGSDGELPTAGFFQIAPRFFQTMNIPILLGRDFTWNDREGTSVGIVNEAFAKKFFPGTSPIGRAIGIPFSNPCRAMINIVGVVGNTNRNLRASTEPLIYLPYRQAGIFGGSMRFIVRAAGDPLGLVPTIRTIMLDLDANVPVYGISTQAEQIDRLLYRERLLSNQLFLFSLLALLQAALGIYGTLNYFVNRRSSEIGIRMAIGAQRREVMRLIVGESLAPVGIGVALGLGAAFMVVRAFRTLLFGVSPADPLTVTLATLFLFVIASFAALLPVRRACQIDPMTVLRHD